MEADSPSTRQRLVQALLGSFIILAGLGSYLAVLKWRGPSVVTVTKTAWDEFIPFQPAWLYVYVAPYPIAPVIFALMRRQTFVWFLKRALLILAVSLLIFAVVPTQTVRPPVDALDDGWTAKFYRGLVAVDDPPGNAAPSLHVSLTCLLAIALLRDWPRRWAVTIGGVLIVWLATLFTWQHHLIDVATGVLLGVLISLPFRVRGK
jgi:membrane-associated phospholipid phosphatase